MMLRLFGSPGRGPSGIIGRVVMLLAAIGWWSPAAPAQTANQAGAQPTPRPRPTPWEIRMMRGQPDGTTSLTTATRARTVTPRGGYSNRPILAVGTLQEIHPSSMTLTVAIDRKLSSMPTALTASLKRLGTEQEVLDREFPPQRTFHWLRMTTFIDGRPSPDRPQTPATTGRILEDRQRIKPEDLKVGERVSVLYRMPTTPNAQPTVLTISRVDPNQQVFEVDFNPLGPGARVQRRVDPDTGRTTVTIIRRGQPPNR
jgi:hypothetical protein